VLTDRQELAGLLQVMRTPVVFLHRGPRFSCWTGASAPDVWSPSSMPIRRADLRITVLVPRR
jgi:hypothetical protein